MEKHGYDVEWIDPATGAHTKIKDPCKGETCVATPPGAGHDWILHISREGSKAGMLKSFKFCLARRRARKLQDIEVDPCEGSLRTLRLPDADKLVAGCRKARRNSA